MSHFDRPQDFQRPNANQVVDALRTATQSENDAQLARWLDIPQTTVSGWRKRGVIPYDACARVAEKTGVSLDGLIFGHQRSSRLKEGTIHKGLFEWAALRVFEGRYVGDLEEDINDIAEIYNDIMNMTGGSGTVESIGQFSELEKIAQARKAERLRRSAKTRPT